MKLSQYFLHQILPFNCLNMPEKHLKKLPEQFRQNFLFQMFLPEFYQNFQVQMTEKEDFA